jgi:hypothetical protein
MTIAANFHAIIYRFSFASGKYDRLRRPTLWHSGSSLLAANQSQAKSTINDTKRDLTGLNKRIKSQLISFLEMVTGVDCR